MAFKGLGGGLPRRCAWPSSPRSSLKRSHPSSGVCSSGRRGGLWRCLAACLWDAPTPLPSAPYALASAAPQPPPPAAPRCSAQRKGTHRLAPGWDEAGWGVGSRSPSLRFCLGNKKGGAYCFACPKGKVDFAVRSTCTFSFAFSRLNLSHSLFFKKFTIT